MPIKQTQNKISQLKLNRGFGLVELIVSVSIMILVMGVILTRNSAFNGASLLRAQAYDMALAIREMQLLAVSATNDGGTGNYRNVYGLVFNKSNPNRYIIFRDGDGDFTYDASEVFGKQGIIDKRYQIDDIRYLNSSGGYDSKDKVTVLFKRPNFDAHLYEDALPISSSIYGVEIVIRLKGTTGDGVNKIRLVEISRAGQITVR